MAQTLLTSEGNAAIKTSLVPEAGPALRIKRQLLNLAKRFFKILLDGLKAL
jgi:hypothetical protein